MKIFQNKVVTVNTALLSSIRSNSLVSAEDKALLDEFIKNYEEKNAKLSKTAGKSLFPEKLSMDDHWSIINRSVTGFYESAISINALFKRK